MDLNFCVYMFGLLYTGELNLKKLRATYCNPDVGLQLSTVFTISSPLKVMLLALLCCSLMTALLQDGWTQIQKVHCWAPQKPSQYGTAAVHNKVTYWYLLFSHVVRKCRKHPSTTANLLHLGSSSLALQSQTLAHIWLWSTARTQDFPPSLHKDAAAKELICTCFCPLWPNAVLPYCTEFKSAGQVWSLPILWQVWFILSCNTHSDCGFWQLALVPDQWEIIIVEKQTWGVDPIHPQAQKAQTIHMQTTRSCVRSVMAELQENF